jgi:predicted RNA-binding Zn-ribbon protein involved in translation (DUF1610 family)
MIATVTNSGPETSIREYRARAFLGSDILILQPKAIVDGFTLKNPDLKPFARWDSGDSLPEKTTRPVATGEMVAGPLRFTVAGKTLDELAHSRWVLEFTDALGNSYQTVETVLSNEPGELPYVPGAGTKLVPSDLPSPKHKDADTIDDLLARAGELVEKICSHHTVEEINLAAALGLPGLESSAGRFRARYPDLAKAILALKNGLDRVVDDRRQHSDPSETCGAVERLLEELKTECDKAIGLAPLATTSHPCPVCGFSIPLLTNDSLWLVKNVYCPKCGHIETTYRT